MYRSKLSEEKIDSNSLMGEITTLPIIKLNRIVNISKSKESNTICFFIDLESLKALDRPQPIYGLALSYIVFYP